MAFVDYYEVLQISRHSSADNIKAAYRTMCKRYHPDTYHGSRAVAERNIRLINEAYGVLRHPADKARYDAQYDALHKPKAPPAAPAPAPARPAAPVKKDKTWRPWEYKRTQRVFFITFFAALAVLGIAAAALAVLCLG